MRRRYGVGIVVLALSMLIATPLASAGHRLEVQARRTVSCNTAEGALQLRAFATNPTNGSAGVTISTGNPTQATGLLGVSSQQEHYGLGSRCHSVSEARRPEPARTRVRRRRARGRCPIADCVLRGDATCPHASPDLVQRLGKAGERDDRGRDAAEGAAGRGSGSATCSGRRGGPSRTTRLRAPARGEGDMTRRWIGVVGVVVAVTVTVVANVALLDGEARARSPQAHDDERQAGEGPRRSSQRQPEEQAGRVLSLEPEQDRRYLGNTCVETS